MAFGLQPGRQPWDRDGREGEKRAGDAWEGGGAWNDSGHAGGAGRGRGDWRGGGWQARGRGGKAGGRGRGGWQEGGKGGDDAEARPAVPPGPPVPLTLDRGDLLWQVYRTRGQWQDVDPSWTQILYGALAQGQPSARVYSQDDDLNGWFTVNLSDPKWITCTSEAPKAKAKELRAVQLKNPRPNVAA
jgi:hypothetical protein